MSVWRSCGRPRSGNEAEMSPPRLDEFDERMVRRIIAMNHLGRLHPRSPGYFRDAGEALLMLRDGKTRKLWILIVHDWCRLSKSRAYELMRLAKGTSLETLRSETSARVRKHRKNKWLPTKAPRQKGANEHILSVSPGAKHGNDPKVRLPRDRQQKARRKPHPRKP
jgi:hypothetical protein